MSGAPRVHVQRREDRLALWIKVPCSRERAWELLIDVQAWPVWGPSVREVRSEARFIRRGSRGEVRVPLGLWLPFEVTSFEPLRRWSWRVAGIEATGHEVISAGPAQSIIGMDVPLWAAPYGVVCAIALRRMAAALSRA